MGSRESASRLRLVEAGAELLQTEGAANFSARRVAEVAGLRPQLVYYYFRTMDDLIVQICEWAGEKSRRRALEAISGKEPLRDLWRVTVEERSAPLTAEVKSLAQKSAIVREATVRMLESYRREVSEQLSARLGMTADAATSGMTILMVCDALSHLLSTERALGVDIGHAQLVEGIERWLDGHYRS
jgi:AcrR family transcriptional regulator